MYKLQRNREPVFNVSQKLTVEKRIYEMNGKTNKNNQNFSFNLKSNISEKQSHLLLYNVTSSKLVNSTKQKCDA